MNELKSKGWTDEQIAKVQEFLDLPENDEDCRDTLRFARSNHPDEVMEYRNIQQGGCCGSRDVELLDGENVIMVGFNYGH